MTCATCGADIARVPRTRSALAALDKAVGIIEVADARAEAADGPVGHVRDEMSDAEWRTLYVALHEARGHLIVAEGRPAPSAAPNVPGLGSSVERGTRRPGSDGLAR
jgi:hypothetical protein